METCSMKKIGRMDSGEGGVNKMKTKKCLGQKNWLRLFILEIYFI